MAPSEFRLDGPLARAGHDSLKLEVLSKDPVFGPCVKLLGPTTTTIFQIRLTTLDLSDAI